MDINWWAVPIVWLFTMVMSFFCAEDEQRPTFFKKASNKEVYWFMVGLYTALGLIGMIMALAEAILYVLCRFTIWFFRLAGRITLRPS